MSFIFNENLYTYHIKDEYFSSVGGGFNLMSNKEDDKFRPNYYAVQEEDSDVMWMIPLSSQIEKYSKIYEEKIKKHGKCLNLVISNYGGKKSVFLLQNMFPILPKYIDHVHTSNGQPLEIYNGIKKEVDKKFKKIMQLKKRGIVIPFTKIDVLYNKMIEEYQKDSILKEVAATKTE